MYASQFYEVANVRILLDKGADINRKNTNGATALIYAADDYYCSRTDHVRALLENGADINAMTNEGKTALMMAAHQGCFDTVKHLLDRGAAVRQKDIYGKTAQDFAEKSKLTGEEREKMLWLLKTAIKPTSRSSSKPAKQLR
jgi:ankyrin repeat protein